MSLPRCIFVVRTLQANGLFAYQKLYVDSPYSTRELELEYPPSIGDCIALGSGTYRVVDRQVRPVKYGSASWPLGEESARKGPMIEFVLETSSGVLRDSPLEGTRFEEGASLPVLDEKDLKLVGWELVTLEEGVFLLQVNCVCGSSSNALRFVPGAYLRNEPAGNLSAANVGFMGPMRAGPSV